MDRKSEGISQRRSHKGSAAPVDAAEPPKNVMKKKQTSSALVLVRKVVLGIAALLLCAQIPSLINVPRHVESAVCKVRSVLQLDSEEVDALAGSAGWENSPFFSADHNRSLFWGTYRPNILAGVRARTPKSLLFGIAWYDEKGIHNVRHTAEDGEDVLFRWEIHDGRYYGRELIIDRQNKMELQVRFLKAPDGRGWRLRVNSKSTAGINDDVNPMIFVVYFINEVEQDTKSEASRRDAHLSPQGRRKQTMGGTGHQVFADDDPLEITGSLRSDPTAQRHGFKATVTDLDAAVESRSLLRSFYSTGEWHAFQRHAYDQKAWDLGDFRRTTKSPERSDLQNVIILKKRFDSGDFRVEVLLNEDGGAVENGHSDTCVVDQAMWKREKMFESRFESVFKVGEKALALDAAAEAIDAQTPPTPQKKKNNRQANDDDDDDDESPPSFPAFRTLISMAHTGLSNMLGGIGYWHGEYLIHNDKNPKKPTAAGPFTLFSGVPSRAKFPRGFLWDEGFHQLLIAKWDAALSKDVISHWIKCMETEEGNSENPVGWIPREQILGTEARSRVPSEFVPQHRTHTNPPAMVLQIQNFALQVQSTAAAGKAGDTFLQNVVPQLELWLRYLLKSQCGGDATKCSQEAVSRLRARDNGNEDKANISYLFRWRSRNNYHLLASGLDDYPRPVCEDDSKELHLDLMCWVGMMDRTLQDIKRAIDGTDTNKDSLFLPDFDHQLDATFWDDEKKRYADVTGCVSRADHNAGKSGKTRPYFSPFYGYVSLFPILTKVLNNAEKAQLMIKSTKQNLLGPYGLQSLSNSGRKMLRQHDDYWTGPIWINLNYLMLRALKTKYIDLLGDGSESENPASQLYDALRLRLVRNIGSEFARTGKLWENYDLTTGRGRGTAPFTGWTSLVIAILSEQYE